MLHASPDVCRVAHRDLCGGVAGRLGRHRHLFRDATTTVRPDALGRPRIPLHQMRLRLHRRRGRGPFPLPAMRQVERADGVLIGRRFAATAGNKSSVISRKKICSTTFYIQPNLKFVKIYKPQILRPIQMLGISYCESIMQNRNIEFGIFLFGL
jgi:hypothetical protein